MEDVIVSLGLSFVTQRMVQKGTRTIVSGDYLGAPSRLQDWFVGVWQPGRKGTQSYQVIEEDPHQAGSVLRAQQGEEIRWVYLVVIQRYPIEDC